MRLNEPVPVLVVIHPASPEDEDELAALAAYLSDDEPRSHPSVGPLRSQQLVLKLTVFPHPVGTPSEAHRRRGQGSARSASPGSLQPRSRFARLRRRSRWARLRCRWRHA